MSSSLEEIKKDIRMKFIYKALEEGWTVKKSSTTPRTFEFTKGDSTKQNSEITTRRSISEPVKIER